MVGGHIFLIKFRQLVFAILLQLSGPQIAYFLLITAGKGSSEKMAVHFFIGFLPIFLIWGALSGLIWIIIQEGKPLQRVIIFFIFLLAPLVFLSFSKRYAWQIIEGEIHTRCNLDLRGY